MKKPFTLILISVFCFYFIFQVAYSEIEVVRKIIDNAKVELISNRLNIIFLNKEDDAYLQANVGDQRYLETSFTENGNILHIHNSKNIKFEIVHWVTNEKGFIEVIKDSNGDGIPETKFIHKVVGGDSEIIQKIFFQGEFLKAKLIEKGVAEREGIIYELIDFKWIIREEEGDGP